MWKVGWLFWSKMLNKWLDTSQMFDTEEQAKSFVWFLVNGNYKENHILLSVESDYRSYHVPVSVETLGNVLPPIVDLQASISGASSVERSNQSEATSSHNNSIKDFARYGAYAEDKCRLKGDVTADPHLRNLNEQDEAKFGPR